LLDHGAIDLILDRRDMRERIAQMLCLMMRKPAPVAEQAA
jgi:acetyl-CoA carboxylase carboxyl transferase subunit beta